MDELRIGVIGVGGRGRLARRFWHRPEEGRRRSRLVAGADVSTEAMNDFRKDVPEAFVTDDWRRVLDRPDVDAVGVFAPDYFHEEMVVAALEAGVHVYCEKPLAITTAGCDRILEAHRASGRKLMIGFNMRYMGFVRVMREVVESGVIGRVAAAWCRHFVGHGGNFYFHDWHARRENTTSLLLQKGVHDIDVMHFVAGGYTRRVAAFGGLDHFGGERPNNLTCQACDERDACADFNPFGKRTQCAFRREVDVEDNQTVLLEIDGSEGPVRGAYLQCHFTPDYHRNYTFIGTEGRLENSEPEGWVKVWTRRSGTARSLADRTYHLKEEKGEHGGSDPRIAEGFVRYVLDDEPPAASPLDGRMSVAAGCAAAESLRAGGEPRDVPPPPAWTEEGYA